jgi:hypothetical protein
MDMNLRSLYIELLKKTLINEIYIENELKLFYLIGCWANRQNVRAEFLVDPDLMPPEFIQQTRKTKLDGTTTALVVRDAQGKWAPDHSLRNFLEFPHSGRLRYRRRLLRT